MKTRDEQIINAIRVLSVDAVQKANSGHPGLPLGAAVTAYALWAKNMIFNPKHATWANRDRFILSAGHGSAMLYALLHLFGYPLTKEDLMKFRQYGSLTPGHPEYGHTVGVETTTGPLGAGLATAVGMAMAEAHQAAKYNRPNFELVNHYIYVLVGDGCLMEGITSEASSLAATLQLEKLIILYDSNDITIEGSTSIAFTENVSKRYEAYGFNTYLVEDGTNLQAVHDAILRAKMAKNGKPSFIEIKTKIGSCSPVEGSAKAHGEPLGVANIEQFKKNINYSNQEPFYVEDDVYAELKIILEQKEQHYNAWLQLFKNYGKAYPELVTQWLNEHEPIAIEDLRKNQELWQFDDKPQATRNVSGIVLNRLKDLYPQLVGGAADLAPSTKTYMNDAGDFSAQNYRGRNLHFGVREHAMAAIGNGLVLYGGLRSYVSTFFVFSDFLKPMLRLSSLMQLPAIYIFTHDSIGVGEDGPTHEPVEQLAMLRSIPNTIVFRPADAFETMVGWAIALTSKTTPVALILSRQNLPPLPQQNFEALKGGYILADSQASPEIILVATGSEVQLALEAKKMLGAKGSGVRVVSMPSLELFLQQDKHYQEKVLPLACRKRVVIEAASSMSWGKIIGLDGIYITLDRYGASGAAATLFEAFGFTAKNICQQIEEYFN